jgi:hypothetical protein
MSSTWARLDGAVRGAIWDVAWRLGTPPVSVPLLALAAVQLGVTAAISSRTASHAFATSWGSWLIAGALVVDAAAALVRAAPVVQGADGRLRWVPPGRRALGAALVACGYLGIALGLAASLASRERLEFRCALGEPCSAAPEQTVSRDPIRMFSPGPFPVRFVVEAGGSPAGEAAPGAVEVQAPGGERTRMGRWRPSWLGWGRFVRPNGAGDVLRYEIRDPRGELVETAFVKLDIEPPGKVDSIRAERVPYRVYVRARRTGGGAAPASLEVAVYRGKLSMAQATVPVGGLLAFEGNLLAFPEWRPWIQFELVSDPGIPLALAGGLLAAVGLALASRRSRRHGGGSVEGRPT